MKQFAIIGLSDFGKRLLEELVHLDCEIILLDKDREVVDLWKDQVSSAYVANAINRETVERLIPADIDAAVVDMGDKIEVSVLVTNYLKKNGVGKVVVKAETEEHGEILGMVGADHVIHPNREAARRITPMLVSDLLFNYFPIGAGVVMAEVALPPSYAGQSLVEADIRQERRLNVVAVRSEGDQTFRFPTPHDRLKENDTLLVVGADEDVAQFAGVDLSARQEGFGDLFRMLFARKR